MLLIKTLKTYINEKILSFIKENFLVFQFADILNIILGAIILVLVIALLYVIFSKRFKINKVSSTTLLKENSMERIIDSFDGLVYICRGDDYWNMSNVSAYSYKLTGYSVEEMLDSENGGFRKLIHPKYHEFLTERWDECILAKEEFREDYKIVTKDKQEKWVRERAHAVYDNNGNVTSIEGYIYDIDKEKELSFKAFFNESRYKSLIDNLEFSIMVFHEHKIIYANPASASFFRAKSKKEIEGMRFDQLITEDYKEFYQTRYNRIQKTKTSNMPTNYKFKRFDGTETIGHLTSSVFFYEDELYLHITILEVNDSEYSAQQLKRMQKRNRDLILYMFEGIGVFQIIPEKLDAKLIFANKNFSRFILGQAKNLIYKNFSEIFSSFSEEETNQIFTQIRTSSYSVQIQNGVNKHFYKYVFYSNPDNELVVQITDVTEIVKANQKYIQERDNLNEILEATKTVTWEWDLPSGRLEVDDRWKGIYDYDDSHFHNFTFSRFKAMIHPKDLLPAGRRLAHLIRHDFDKSFSIELRTKHKNGHYIWGLYKGKIFENDENGKPKKIRGTFQDITSIKEKELQIHYLSRHDHLTGLHNRRALDEYLKSIDTPDNYPISILMVDVDALKIMNDAFGHDEGDKLLVETGKILNRFTKKKDFLGRTGGDEFILIMPNTLYNDAKMRINAMRKELSKNRIKGIPISLSLGLATKALDTQSIEHVKNQAESEMYEFKINNSNTRIEILNMIQETLFQRYPFEKEVSILTHELSMKLAKFAKLESMQMKVIDPASTYYNIGVIGINKDVLSNDKNINEDEDVEYHKHVEIGFRILSSIFRFENIASTVLYHHEKYNGKGYPSGLAKEQIPIESRIIAICGAYSRYIVMKNTKRKSMVIKFIESEKGKSFDPKLVDLFIEKVI